MFPSHIDWAAVCTSIGALASVGVAVALVIITYRYATDTRKLVEVTRTYTAEAKRMADETKHMTEVNARMVAETVESRFASQRPALLPVLALSSSPLKMGTALTYMQIREVPDFNVGECEVALSNFGVGPALDVCGILMDAQPTPGTWRRFTTWKQETFHAGESRIVTLRIGCSVAGGTAKLAEFTLGPPPKPADSEIMAGRAPNRTARLTLTYGDVFGRKHATIVDYTQTGVWVDPVFVANIDEDLDDIDAAARSQSVSSVT